MAIYSYTCMECDLSWERNVPIDDRDEQFCEECGYRLGRNIVFTGSVYAATAGGMR